VFFFYSFFMGLSQSCAQNRRVNELTRDKLNFFFVVFLLSFILVSPFNIELFSN
jgi:hypothetical protein